MPRTSQTCLVTKNKQVPQLTQAREVLPQHMKLKTSLLQITLSIVQQRLEARLDGRLPWFPRTP